MGQLHDGAMGEMFQRVVYYGPAGKDTSCQVAICRRLFGTTVLFEDLPENTGAISGHAIEVLL
jgi:hypothetical protein